MSSRFSKEDERHVLHDIADIPAWNGLVEEILARLVEYLGKVRREWFGWRTDRKAGGLVKVFSVEE